MLKNKRKSVVIIIVLTLTLVVYLFYSKSISLFKGEESNQQLEDSETAVLREISVVNSYSVPEGEDIVRYTVSIDNDGLIVDVKARGEFDSSSDINLAKFSKNLLLVIKGKKLADLENVDRVGKSSLTTASFNDSLEELKAQI